MSAPALRGGFDLAVIDPLQSLAAAIAKTEFVPGNLRNRPEAILACFITGQEVGISPMQSLRQIDVIEGRPSLRAELMRALVFERGYSMWFGEGNEYTSTRVCAYGRRGASEPVTRVEWTMDQARTAGLANRGPWRAHPRAMLTARATSELCRLIFPDVVAGMGFIPEELVEVSNAHDVSEAMEDIIEADELRQMQALPAADTTQPTTQAEVIEPTDDVPPVEGSDKSVEMPAQTKAEKERAMKVVRLAKALGIDHHPIVEIVTTGEKSSASHLTKAEGDAVVKLIHAIGDGEVDISTGEVVSTRAEEPIEHKQSSNGKRPESKGIDFDDRDNPDPETWDSLRWRAYLGERGVSIVDVLRQAATLVGDGAMPIGSLHGLKGSGIAEALRDYVDDVASNR